MASGVPFPVDPAGPPPRKASDIELISMWVAPSARGHGVADVLIQDLVAWAANLGAKAVGLSVRDTNAPAIALYRRHGFEATGERATDEDHTLPP
jgi:ribosomal protein S18 acetylase RimI-like enzyme